MKKPRYIDMTGQRFGRLVVLQFVKCDGTHSHWLCRCDCGVTVTTIRNSLIRGLTKSCGCLQKELLSIRSKKHGLCKSGTRWSYGMMMQRCYNPLANHYDYYGGRGIAVCQRWKDSFEAFVEDMGIRPENKTLDRIDSNGNYEPSNCRWATRSEQQNNRRDNRLVTVDGITKNVKQWYRATGISYRTLLHRADRGVTGVAFLTLPKKRRRLKP